MHAPPQRHPTDAPLRRPVLSRLAAGRRRDDPRERGAGRIAEQAASPAATILPPPRETGAPASHSLPPQVHDVLRAPGEPLDAEARAALEPRFGWSFASVRVHADARAAESAASVRARAYTAGSHVVFAAGEYAPRTAPGRRVLAHELAHVAQQERAGAAAPGSAALPLQRLPQLGGDIHGPIVEDYRRRHGLPEGGVGDAGTPAGPSDAEIKYRLSDAARLGKLAALSPWDLSRAPPSDLLPSPGSPSAARFADWERAAKLCSAVFARFKVKSDPDAAGVVGRVPTAAEQAVLDAGLERILGLADVRAQLTGPGGRGVPTAPAPAGAKPGAAARPSLAGKVRIATDATEYGIKRYQLELTVVGLAGQNPAELDRGVRDLWTEFRVAPGPAPEITAQERKAAVLVILMVGMGNPGFYHPGDDVVYLAPGTDLKTSDAADVARHETAHLLGGREATRRAFVARYGDAKYIPYWSTFEEGVAELLAEESAPKGQKPPKTTTTTVDAGGGATVTVEKGGSAYGPLVAKVRKIMADPTVGRAGLLRAYFTGAIPERVFQLLEKEVKP